MRLRMDALRMKRRYVSYFDVFYFWSAGGGGDDVEDDDRRLMVYSAITISLCRLRSALHPFCFIILLLSSCSLFHL